MAVSLREYRAKIKSVESTKKITRAMELIAASRIIKAQQRAQAAAPYARELTRAVSALATYSSVDHPMTTEPENPTKAAVLIITSDRGLAGAYSSNVLKEGERLAERLRSEDKKVTTFIAGRKGEAYYRFRDRPVAGSWSGFSDQPKYDNAHDIGEALISAFMADQGEDESVDEVHLVYTRFVSMLSQVPTATRIAPLEVEYADLDDEQREAAKDRIPPSYEFEPSAMGKPARRTAVRASPAPGIGVTSSAMTAAVRRFIVSGQSAGSDPTRASISGTMFGNDSPRKVASASAGVRGQPKALSSAATTRLTTVSESANTPSQSNRTALGEKVVIVFTLLRRLEPPCTGLPKRQLDGDVPARATLSL